MHRVSRIALLLVVFSQLIGAVNIIYDETAWTKLDWHKYKIEYSPQLEASPADSIIKSAAVRKALGASKINSLDGPVERTPFARVPGVWSSDDGSLFHSQEDDAIDAAAEAAMCTVCHGLVSHVWQQVVHAIDTAEPLNEGSVRDMFDEACEDQVPKKVLHKYRIVRVTAPEAGVTMFVVRDRRPNGPATPSSPGSPPEAAGSVAGPPAPVTGKTDGRALGLGGSAAASTTPDVAAGTEGEVQATHQACTDLVNHHVQSMMQQVWGRAQEYFIDSKNLAQKVMSKLQLDADDEDEYEQPVAEEGDAELEQAALQHLPPHKLIPIEGAHQAAQAAQPALMLRPLLASIIINEPAAPLWTSHSCSRRILPSLLCLLPADFGLHPLPCMRACTALCLDMEMLCPFWASVGECEANPRYMVGTSKKLGHCKASCGTCKADVDWRQHPLATRELAAAARTKANVLRNSACTSSKACMAGGSSSIPGSSAAVIHDDILPGARLVKQTGFVLGKPFWNLPDTVPDPKPAGGITADASDAADVLLIGGNLHNTLVSIRGMDDFFVYQLTYKRRVYQFHRDAKSGQITEDHVLGVYDEAATKAAALRDDVAPLTEAGKAWQDAMQGQPQQQQRPAVETPAAKIAAMAEEARKKKAAAEAAAASAGSAEGAKPDAAAAGAAADAKQPQQTPDAAAASQKPPPFLDLLDYLPDKPQMADSWWPYTRQMFTNGERCMAEGSGRNRQVELRVACSPNTVWHLLVREPEFCRYIMVLFHPGLCSLPRYKPVRRPRGSTLAGTAKVAAS